MNLLSGISLLSLKMSPTYVVTVVLTGLIVVFTVLVLLVIFVSLFGKIFTLKNSGSNNEKKVEKKEVAVKKTEPVAVTPANNGISAEVVAVISAAIAAISESEGKKFVVRSIKKTNASPRLGWGNAGIVENTRPF